MPDTIECGYNVETDTSEVDLGLKDFWYILAQSKDVVSNRALSRQLFGERIVLFRDENDAAVALEDRCLHRAAPLSKGNVKDGRLQCAYHGWVYDGQGCVANIPSACNQREIASHHKSFKYALNESEGYIYFCPSRRQQSLFKPFSIPFYQQRGWEHIRLVNRFKNNVTNCVENFVDIPHTAYVHDRIFRSEKTEIVTASVVRSDGKVHVIYRGERSNAGVYGWFLNPRKKDIYHTDTFLMPNVTCVEYGFGKKRFFITSQSIPISEDETLVYTDLTYNYGIWNKVTRPFIKKYAQKIIDQDIVVLEDQMLNIKHYGYRFTNTDADIIHVFIESIRKALDLGQDPRCLPNLSKEIRFRV